MELLDHHQSMYKKGSLGAQIEYHCSNDGGEVEGISRIFVLKEGIRWCMQSMVGSRPNQNKLTRPGH